jgi:hypothetical protein
MENTASDMAPKICNSSDYTTAFVNYSYHETSMPVLWCTPNIIVKHSELLLHIWEVLDSVLSLQINYPDKFFWGFTQWLQKITGIVR